MKIRGNFSSPMAWKRNYARKDAGKITFLVETCREMCRCALGMGLLDQIEDFISPGSKRVPTSCVPKFAIHGSQCQTHGTFGDVEHFKMRVGSFTEEAIALLSLRLAVVYCVQYHIFRLFTPGFISNNYDSLLPSTVGRFRDLYVASSLPSNGVDGATAGTNNVAV